MNLPLVVDIATGLIFIYLTLSLIASELQELLSTLLQWRAKHLTRSIETLLSGGSEANPTQLDRNDLWKAKKLVEELYNDPLINTLNYEANIGRWETRFREISKHLFPKKILDQRNSAASYIPSETFATTLLQTLKLPELIQRARKVSGESQVSLNTILASYNELQKLIPNSQKQSYQDLQSEDNEELRRIYGNIDDHEFQTIINSLPKHLPDSVITSLAVLAKRSKIKTKAKVIDEELNQFREEVETWFDRSMERASGVYKRNAKGVALLIGLAIAILTNTDTFHVISRLSRDSAVRNVITQNVSQQQNFNDPAVKRQFYKDLDDVSLPLGWDDGNLSQQEYELSQLMKSTTKVRFQEVLRIIYEGLRMLLGWIITGIAISMGAPFWFDMLKKVMNVRGTGPKPETYTKDRSAED
jgi:hypothetical protein